MQPKKIIIIVIVSLLVLSFVLPAIIGLEGGY
jgi:hypothetical protein